MFIHSRNDTESSLTLVCLLQGPSLMSNEHEWEWSLMCVRGMCTWGCWSGKWLHWGSLPLALRWSLSTLGRWWWGRHRSLAPLKHKNTTRHLMTVPLCIKSHLSFLKCVIANIMYQHSCLHCLKCFSAQLQGNQSYLKPTFKTRTRDNFRHRG